MAAGRAISAVSIGRDAERGRAVVGAGDTVLGRYLARESRGHGRRRRARVESGRGSGARLLSGAR